MTQFNRIIIITFSFIALMLAGCGGGRSSSSSVQPSAEPIRDEEVTGLITDFFGDAFKEWGQSEFLIKIGLDPEPASAQQLNQVLSQLGTIQQEVVNVQQGINTLIGDFTNLETQMANDNFKTQSAYLGQIMTGANINWNQYLNAVNCNPAGTCSESLGGIANDPGAISALQQLFTDSFFNSLAYETAVMSNAGSPGDPNNATVPDLLISAKNLLVANINSKIAAGQNIVPLFDQYNNGLMYYYYYLVNDLQQIYAIEQTLLYLKQSNPSVFGSISLGEPGIVGNATYATNYAALNTLYQTRLSNLATLFGAAIISDAGAGSPTAAKTLASLPTGSWTAGSACQLYVWTGLLPTGQTGFEGSWDGSTLKASCSGATTTITPTVACAKGAQVGVYQGTNAAGNALNQLQCSQMNPAALTAPSWQNAAGYDYGGAWSYMDSQATMTIDLTGFGASTSTKPYATQISGPLTYASKSNSWSTNAAKLPAVAFTSLWQYNAIDGFTGAFAVLAEENMHPPYSMFAIELQILCLPGDPWCTQLPGTNPGGSGGTPCKGSSAICLGHQKITFTCTDSGNAIQALKYAGQAC